MALIAPMSEMVSGNSPYIWHELKDEREGERFTVCGKRFATWQSMSIEKLLDWQRICKLCLEFRESPQRVD